MAISNSQESNRLGSFEFNEFFTSLKKIKDLQPGELYKNSTSLDFFPFLDIASSKRVVDFSASDGQYPLSASTPFNFKFQERHDPNCAHENWKVVSFDILNSVFLNNHNISLNLNEETATVFRLDFFDFNLFETMKKNENISAVIFNKFAWQNISLNVFKNINFSIFFPINENLWVTNHKDFETISMHSNFYINLLFSNAYKSPGSHWNGLIQHLEKSLTEASIKYTNHGAVFQIITNENEAKNLRQTLAENYCLSSLIEPSRLEFKVSPLLEIGDLNFFVNLLKKYRTLLCIS